MHPHTHSQHGGQHRRQPHRHRQVPVRRRHAHVMLDRALPGGSFRRSTRTEVGA
jgi:hypothetical protein